MRKASIRDLHIHTSELVREAEEGSVIVVERRGQPVAELRPLAARRALSKEARSRLFAQMESVWAASPRALDSTLLIEEDRNR